MEVRRVEGMEVCESLCAVAGHTELVVPTERLPVKGRTLEESMQGASFAELKHERDTWWIHTETKVTNNVGVMERRRDPVLDVVFGNHLICETSFRRELFDGDLTENTAAVGGVATLRRGRG